MVLHAAGLAGTSPVEHAGILVLEVHPAAEVGGHRDFAPATFLLQHFLQGSRGLCEIGAVAWCCDARYVCSKQNQAVYGWTCGERLVRPSNSVSSAICMLRHCAVVPNQGLRA